MTITKSQLTALLENVRHKRVMVIGDLMVDEYLSGSVRRISPEAPVPVVNVEKRELRLGGAANVAFNLAALGCKTELVGVVGEDNMGRHLADMLIGKGMADAGLIRDPSRPTTLKTRIMADSQHITRVDHEISHDVNATTESQILTHCQKRIPEVDGIILQDYNKGVLTPKVIESIIAFANRHNILVAVDPKKVNFLNYKNVTVFKPNLKEAEEATGLDFGSDSLLPGSGQKLREMLSCEAVLVTRGPKGMALIDEDFYNVPTQARNVAEVSGAGDTVISTFTAFRLAGASLRESAYLANVAAGYVVEQVGIVPITTAALVQRISR
jgi:rfaE bifunctional protein kinase chain/domain